MASGRRIICAFALAAMGLGMFFAARDARAAEKKPVGALVCDYLVRREWGPFWKTVNPLAVLHENGLDWTRVWVTTVSSEALRTTPPAQWPSLPWQSEYWSCLEYGERIMEEAGTAGMRLNLVLFLSDKAAHAGVQDAPAAWTGLTVEETAAVLRHYCYRTAKYFKDKSFDVELYDIGNEIERGILNFRPGERIVLPPGVDQTTDMEYMRGNVWNVEAALLKAAIAGVKEADPDGKIVLHAGGTGLYPGNLLIRTFFQTMAEEEVPFDYAGLSYPYLFAPSSIPQPYFRSSEWRELLDTLAALGKPVFVSESSYPNDTAGIGGAPCPGYPFTPEGQRTWVRDMLFSCLNDDAVAGVFYWYPDYFPGMSFGSSPELESSGLFASDTTARPALAEFRPDNLYRGDVDGDLAVDLADAILCLRVAAGLDANDAPGADADGDGTVGVADTLLIVRRIIGTNY